MIKHKTITIIGGTDGIGQQIARELVATNRVIIVGRSELKGQAFEEKFGTNAHFYKLTYQT